MVKGTCSSNLDGKIEIPHCRWRSAQVGPSLVVVQINFLVGIGSRNLTRVAHAKQGACAHGLGECPNRNYKDAERSDFTVIFRGAAVILAAAVAPLDATDRYRCPAFAIATKNEG